jgi:hypothetical protein
MGAVSGPELFHAFRVIDTDQQPQVPQAPFQHPPIALEQIAWHREVRWRPIDVESVSFTQNTQKIWVRERFLFTALARPANVPVHEIFDGGMPIPVKPPV